MATKIIKPSNPATRPGKKVFNFPLRTKYIILALTGLIFYANTLSNEYAFDDGGVILKNAYVQMGFPGIFKIITNDSFASYYTFMGGEPLKQLSGGRYRPLSEILFAIEQQLFGNSTMLPHFQHMVNIIAYMACILAIFYFLEKFLLKKIPGGSDIAFVAAFLFAIHPLHTEVVANIKSLDEILSLLFIILTFIYSLKYLQNKKTKHLIFGAGSFLFALLAKEYAATLLFFIPFLFYLLENKKIMQALKVSIPYYVVFGVYLALRYNAVGFHSGISNADLLSNPYLYASPAQKIATEWFVMGKYLGLLFFPYPLACDYSYYQIPYHNFSNITVLLSLVIYIGIFIWGIRLALKKNVLSFAVFFFLLNIFMISNFVFNIGATMGERLVFHSSLGLVIILSYYLFKAMSKLSGITLQTKRNILTVTLSIITIVCLGETVIRNTQWKNDASLFIHDVSVVPNSCIVNNNAGLIYINLSERNENTIEQTNACLDSAHKYILQALHFAPRDQASYLNLGLIYFRREQPDSAKYYWDILKKLNPDYPGLKLNYALLCQHYFTQGLNLAMKNGKLHEGISYMKKALLLDSIDASIWYDLGIAYYHTQQYDSARYAFIKTLQNKPNNKDSANAQKDLQDLSLIK